MRRALLMAALPAIFLLAACGSYEPVIIQPIENIDLPPIGTFTVEISGALDARYTGEGEAILDEAMGRAVYLEDTRYSVNIVLPIEQTVGTFPVLPLLSAFDNLKTVGGVGGVIVETLPDAVSSLPRLFDNVSSGRVTFLSITPMTGALEFTATDGDGEQVSVRATFNALPLAARATP